MGATARMQDLQRRANLAEGKPERGIRDPEEESGMEKLPEGPMGSRPSPNFVPTDERDETADAREESENGGEENGEENGSKKRGTKRGTARKSARR
jgi:hypothetical protein